MSTTHCRPHSLDQLVPLAICHYSRGLRPFRRPPLSQEEINDVLLEVMTFASLENAHLDIEFLSFLGFYTSIRSLNMELLAISKIDTFGLMTL